MTGASNRIWSLRAPMFAPAEHRKPLTPVETHGSVPITSNTREPQWPRPTQPGLPSWSASTSKKSPSDHLPKGPWSRHCLCLEPKTSAPATFQTMTRDGGVSISETVWLHPADRVFGWTIARSCLAPATVNRIRSMSPSHRGCSKPSWRGRMSVVHVSPLLNSSTTWTWKLLRLTGRSTLAMIFPTGVRLPGEHGTASTTWKSF